MGERDSWPDPLPEPVRRALLSNPTILRKLCKLGGYEDVELSVEELIRESPIFNAKPSEDIESATKLLPERIGSGARAQYLIEVNLEGRRVSTLLKPGEEKRGDLTRKYIVITQEYENEVQDGVSRLEISTSEKRNHKRVDILFGIESGPSFFHAKFAENGFLDWCSFICSPPVDRVFSKRGASMLEEKEFMHVVPEWQKNVLRVGVYHDTAIRTVRPVRRGGLGDYIIVPLSQESGSEIEFSDHSLYTALEGDRLTIHHTNKRSLEQQSPDFITSIPRKISPQDINSLFSSDGPTLVEACGNLALCFSLPSLWMELDLRKTLPK